MSAHQGKFRSSLVGVGLVSSGITTGVTLGGFQFLGCLTFFIGGLTIATGLSTTMSIAFSDDVIISKVEHPFRNRMDVSSNTLVVASLIEYTNKH
jgi:hypothetical protein